MKALGWIVACAAAVCLPARAGTETGTVRFQYGQYQSSTTSAGKTFFFLDAGVKSGSPACAADQPDRWVINNDWPAAKMQLAVLLTAAATGKSVTVRGSADCGVYSNTETAIDIFVTD